MVEPSSQRTAAAQAKLQSSGQSPETLVWSQHDEIHKLAVQPVRALINLVGSKDTTHRELKEIIQMGIRDIITKQNNQQQTYAPPLVRIQSFDLPSHCPRGPKRNRNNAPQSSTNEIGFLKRNFFTSFAYNKPAVTIFVFDWRDWAKYVPAGETFDWKEHETLVLQQIKQHTQEWMNDLSVPSKYMIIILFPQPIGAREITLNVDQCMASFKRAVQLSGDENIKSSNYFLSNGLETLKSGMLKRFTKDVHGLVVSYYREKKNNIKRKARKLIQGQLQHIRYTMHSAFYSLVTSNDFGKTIDKLDQSYGILKNIQIGNASKWNDEKRENADIIAMAMLSLYLQSGQLNKFIEFYRQHYRDFQKTMASLRPELKLEEMKWRSCWFNTIGQLLERYYKQKGGLTLSYGHWYNQVSLDLFPGYYFLNCMQQLIARQQELQRMKIDCLATGRPLIDTAALDAVIKSGSRFIGKEFEMVDQSQAGKTYRSGEKFEESVQMYRLYEESKVKLGIHILTAGQLAIGYYKQRSQIMKGPTGQMYPRTVHFINYHLSELMDKRAGEDESEISSSREVKQLISTTDKQKTRRTIQAQLCKEKWTKEAVTVLEKSKTNSASLDEYFQNEMRILMNAHNLQNHKRHNRFIDLIDKVQNDNCVDTEPIKLTGIVQGTSLLWARARFEHSKIQINKFNKLTLEVFSRLTKPIKISKLTIMMSQVDLNQEIDFTKDDNLPENFFVLSKSNPIRLERQFYLHKEDDQIGQIMLNQIMLEVAPKKFANVIDEAEERPQNKLAFSISPYLAPQENLIDLGVASLSSQNRTTKQIKRLPPPIMYTIEAMPHKIQIESVLSDSKEQALLGDPYDIKLKLKTIQNVQLKSIKAHFINFSTSTLKDGAEMDYIDRSRPGEASDDPLKSQEGMVDVDLTQASDNPSPFNTMIQTDSDAKFSRLSASMFSPNMSSFYQNARSMMSSQGASMGASQKQLNQSLFLGADPSIGVAVLKRSLTHARREKLQVPGGNQAVGDLINNVEEVDEDTDFQSVELFYTRGESTAVEDLKNIIVDADVASDDKTVDLLNGAGQIDDLNLKMLFYQEEKLNNLTVRFQYEFTQNQGLEDEAIHLKAFDYNIKVHSQSPFDVQWQIKSCDSFMSSLQHFFSLHLSQPDSMRKFISQFTRRSIFDQSSSLSIKEEISALTSNMLAPEEQSCWLVCKLTSQAKYKDVTLKNLRLEMNPEVAEFVQVIDAIGCNNSEEPKDEDDQELLTIEPGESYEVLFKLDVGKIRLARSYLGDQEGLGSGGPSGGPSAGQENQLVDFVNMLKQLYTLEQVELFSELHFEWASLEPKEDTDDYLIQLDTNTESKRGLSEMIPCCVGSPSINFVTIPLQVRVRNQREVQTVRRYEPFTVEYEITNLTKKVIMAVAELQTFNDGPAKLNFMIAGEIRSKINLMPTDEGYILRYTFFPQELGCQSLPKLSIMDTQMPTIHLIKDFTVKVYVNSA